MVGFRHFLKIGAEYPLCSNLSGHLLADYIDEFIDFMDSCNKRIGERLCQYLIGKSSVCVTEYSRAVFAGLSMRIKLGALSVILVNRSAQEVQEEDAAARKRLGDEGALIMKELTQEEWIAFLQNILREKETVDVILFGSESITHTGDNVFPQILSAEELSLLAAIVERSEERR